MENGQFVMEHHSCPISSLDFPRRVHLKEGIWLHYCIYVLQDSCGYTLFMPVCSISSRWLTDASHWLKYCKITDVTPHETHSLFQQYHKSVYLLSMKPKNHRNATWHSSTPLWNKQQAIFSAFFWACNSFPGKQIHKLGSENILVT